MSKRETIGKKALDAMQKDLDTRDPIELQKELQKNYIDELISCIQKDMNKYDGNFFCVVITKREPLLPNVLRNYFFTRSTCPTPDYDQTVFMYNNDHETIEYIWCIPDRETCITLKENAINIHASEKKLLQHIMDFSDGTLYTLCKKLNKEDEYGRTITRTT